MPHDYHISIRQSLSTTSTSKNKSYFKDSTDFIKKIYNLGNIPENSISITLDSARSRYTIISHKEDIQAVEMSLKCKNKATRMIITFLKLILILNNFFSICKNYLQIKRCDLGTKCASTCTNICMGMLKENYIYYLIEEKLYKMHRRYISSMDRNPRWIK